MPNKGGKKLDSAKKSPKMRRRQSDQMMAEKVKWVQYPKTKSRRKSEPATPVITTQSKSNLNVSNASINIPVEIHATPQQRKFFFKKALTPTKAKAGPSKVTAHFHEEEDIVEMDLKQQEDGFTDDSSQHIDLGQESQTEQSDDESSEESDKEDRLLSSDNDSDSTSDSVKIKTPLKQTLEDRLEDLITAFIGMQKIMVKKGFLSEEDDSDAPEWEVPNSGASGNQGDLDHGAEAD